MKLSELILRRAAVDRLSWNSVYELAQTTATNISADLTQASTLAAATHCTAIAGVLDSLKAAEQALANAKQALRAEIDAKSTDYFSKSEKWYQTTKTYDSPEYVMSHALQWEDSELSTVRMRVLNSTDWRHPLVVLRPYSSPFLKDIVAGDPVYFVDQNPELNTLAAKTFSAEYQRRLGLYTFNENSAEFLAGIPDGQIGFVLATNYFEFISFEVLKQFLREIWTKVKPGGVVGFTFNDCDRYIAVLHTEANYAAFTPGHLIKAYAEHLGFEIQFETPATDSSTWLELKKPGVLESLRGGQCLAKIIDRPANLA